MKLRCVTSDSAYATVGQEYEVTDDCGGMYSILSDVGVTVGVFKDNLRLRLNSRVQFWVVGETQEDSNESVQIAAIRSIQEQCSKANLSISIDPSGFNIFDCDTDMQTMVHSVEEAIEILETKIEYKDSMGKWGWL